MFGFPKFGDGIGLHRMDAFIEERGIRWHERPKNLVIVGSKGKGSTARLTAALLQASGQSVGCFTSPHLHDVRERFRIDDQLIPQADFDRLLADVTAWNARRPEGDRIGGFEAMFLLGLLWFNERRPDTVVWEAGLGGRFDPTRALKADWGALTSVEMEHVELLGPTLEHIAYNKLDVLAQDGTMVISPSVPAELRDRLWGYAAVRGLRLREVAQGGVRVDAVSVDAEGTTCTLRWPSEAFLSDSQQAPGERRLRLGLIGAHQIDNVRTALTLARSASVGFPDAPVTDAEADALANLRIEGRMERVSRDPDLWIDVAHTPKSVDAVAEAFLQIVPRQKALIVFGASAGKDTARMSNTLARRFGYFLVTQSPNGGESPERLRSHLAFMQRRVETIPDVVKCMAYARGLAVRDGLTILVVGSVYLAAAARFAWEGRDPGELVFL